MQLHWSLKNKANKQMPNLVLIFSCLKPFSGFSMLFRLSSGLLMEPKYPCLTWFYFSLSPHFSPSSLDFGLTALLNNCQFLKCAMLPSTERPLYMLFPPTGILLVLFSIWPCRYLLTHSSFLFLIIGHYKKKSPSKFQFRLYTPPLPLHILIEPSTFLPNRNHNFNVILCLFSVLKCQPHEGRVRAFWFIAI